MNVMNMNGKWGSIFKMIWVSIIYRISIISIANISRGFVLSDTLFLFNYYKIVNDKSVTSDRYIYMYYHLYKAPITPRVQDVILFSYLEEVEGLPTDSIRKMYYDERAYFFVLLQKNNYQLTVTWEYLLILNIVK